MPAISALRLSSNNGQIPLWAGRKPRAWQSAALPISLNACRQRERGIIHAVMGSGKSILIAEICAAGRGRVLVTTPTVRLVEQLATTLNDRCPGEVGTYYTDSKQADYRITVCCLPSVPTLLADPQWPGPPALWIADEAHREGPSLRDAAPGIAAPRALGFTATPYRSSEQDSLILWDREIYSYGVADALRDGVIVPFRQIPWTGEDDIDLDTACLAMAKVAVQHGPGLINACSIEDATMFAAMLNDSGLRAAAIHSRQPKAEQNKILAGLRAGKLQAIVHVALLTEGVDYPWLRWLLMRRSVKSRVRFAQEVGRVLRSEPGKTEALLYDPHDLLGKLSLSYEAVLGLIENAQEDEEETAFSRELQDIVQCKGHQPLSPISPKQLEAWRRYLRAIYISAMTVGLIDCRVKSTKWRSYEITEKQMGYIQRQILRLKRDTRIPIEHRKAMKEIADNVQHLTKGDGSDFISLLLVFANSQKENPDIWGMITHTPQVIEQ